MNKKSQSFRDVVFLMIVLLFLGIMGVASTYVTTQFVTALKTDPSINSTPAAVTVLDSAENITDKWDLIILATLVGFSMAMIILGFFIKTHSVFFPIFVFLLIFGFPVALIIEYVWEQFSGNPTFDATREAKFPVTDFIFTNLGIFYTVIGGLALVVTYAKPGGGNLG